MIDFSTDLGKRAKERLEREIVGWLITVGSDGTPQPSPIWYLWEADTVLIYSQPNTPKVRNIERHPQASFHLEGDNKGGNIIIEVEDDGRGLDKDAILAKAISRGLVKPGETPTEREIFNLVFEPGFSTAKQVTDVSGRGVGMDVVRRNIENLRGQIEIRSELGHGSVFSMRLPLTLAIIDGMVVRVHRLDGRPRALRCSGLGGYGVDRFDLLPAAASLWQD